jgi:hypothetical protein
MTAFGAWSVFVMAILLIFNVLSFELYLLLCLIGFLAIDRMAGPVVSSPLWRSRINLAVIIGVLASGLIIAVEFLDIL